MNVREFVDKAKGDLELFAQEFERMQKETSGDGRPAPESEDAAAFRKDQGLPVPSEEELWYAEFQGFMSVDPDNPDTPPT